MDGWEDMSTAPKGEYVEQTYQTEKGPRTRSIYKHVLVLAYREGLERPLVTRWIPPYGPKDDDGNHKDGSRWEGFGTKCPPTSWAPIPGFTFA